MIVIHFITLHIHILHTVSTNESTGRTQKTKCHQFAQYPNALLDKIHRRLKEQGHPYHPLEFHFLFIVSKENGLALTPPFTSSIWATVADYI